MADAIVLADDEDRRGAEGCACDCRTGNQRIIRTPSNARPHANQPAQAAPLVLVIWVSYRATVKPIIMYT
jgi:hypothetical protein